MAGSATVGGQNFGYCSSGQLLNRSVKLFDLYPFGPGDTVGMGINFIKHELFYTINGSFYPKIVQLKKLMEYFPTVSLDGPATELQVNFGRSPFKFDLESFFHLEVAAVVEAIVAVEVDRGSLLRMVQDHLHKNALKNTYLAFSRHFGLPLLDFTRLEPLASHSAKRRLSSQPADGCPAPLAHTAERAAGLGRPPSPQPAARGDALVPDHSFFPQRCAIRGLLRAGKFGASEKLLQLFFPKVACVEAVQAMYLCQEFLQAFVRDRGQALRFAKSRFAADKKHFRFYYLQPDRSLASRPLKVRLE